MLEEFAKAFNQIDVSDMTRSETIQFVTGKEYNEAKWGDELDKAKELIFIPNAHLGPYIRHPKLEIISTFTLAHICRKVPIYVSLSWTVPRSWHGFQPWQMTPACILQMIAENGKMRSQEIMEAINLSQPSVSRYLSAYATGYLQERRENGAKVYILNNERIEKTFKAISAFLLDRS